MNDIIWSVGMTLDQLEQLVIQKAYRFYRNNKTATARSLGISVRTLDSKLERYAKQENEAKERMTHEANQRTEFLSRARGNPPNNLGIPYQPFALSNPANAGVRMESVTNSSPKHELPLPVQKEVQGVLPKQTSTSSSKKSS